MNPNVISNESSPKTHMIDAKCDDTSPKLNRNGYMPSTNGNHKSEMNVCGFTKHGEPTLHVKDNTLNQICLRRGNHYMSSKCKHERSRIKADIQIGPSN
jgi:hypothetical protein